MKKEEKLEIFDVDSERQRASEYVKMFNKAKTFNNDRHEAYAELMAFYQGNQSLLKKYANKKPWVIEMNTPYASVAVDVRVASLLASDYIGELFPTSIEDAEKVEILNMVHEKEHKRLDLDNKIRNVIRTGAIVREGYLHFIYNKSGKGSPVKGLGSIEAYIIEPGAVYIDPSARAMKDARFMAVVERIDRDVAEAEYPKLKSLRASGDNYSPQDRGEVYYDNDYNTEQDNVYTKINMYVRTPENKYKKIILIQDIIVKEKDLEIDCFPIAQFRWKKAAQSCYGLGLYDDVLSLQKAICSIESAITNTAIAYAAPSWMVKKGSGIDPNMVAKTSGAPGVVYLVNGSLDEAMKTVTPPKIDETILRFKTDFEEKIKEIAGATQQFKGNFGSAGNTSGGAKMSAERSRIVEMSVLQNIGEFVEDVTNILTKYIIFVYGGEKGSYIRGKENGKFVFDEFEMPKTDDFKDIDYKFYIMLDQKTPYSRDRQKELLLELYQFENQYNVPIKTVTIPDIIKMYDLENKQELTDRYSKLSFQDAQEKADIINRIVSISNDLGINANLVSQAMVEIISSVQKTPAVDQILSEIESGMEQQLNQVDEVVANATGQMM